jgi:flagellar biosynthetic protein FlhB
VSGGGGGGGEKTEKPTPKKLHDARKEGRVARTQDIGAWAGVLVGAYLCQLTVAMGGPLTRDMLTDAAAVAADPTQAAALAALVSGGRALVVLLGPLCLALAVVSIAAGAAQGGLHLATKNLKPKLSRMSPLQGFKRIAGPQAVWEAVKSVTKSAVAAYIAYRAVVGVMPMLTSNGALPLAATLELLADVTLDLIRNVALAGFVMGLADYAYQRRRVGKQLKMTRHEVKQEHKQSEGDPYLKAAVRSRQMAMSRNRMMSRIAEADVVVVNPTHVAVALRYQPERGAPRVVAKGADAVAARIREEAAKHRVPLVSDVPLARALHAACDLDDEIPAQLFTAVAQVLAFVLSLRAKGSAAGTHRIPPPRPPARR